MSEMTRDAALAQLHRLAAGVREVGAAEAVARLLERITATEDPVALRAALTELGAAAVLERARAQTAEECMEALEAVARSFGRGE